MGYIEMGLFQENDDGEFVVDFVDKKMIGFDVSTKSVGNFRRQDLTALYKHPEGEVIIRFHSFTLGLITINFVVSFPCKPFTCVVTNNGLEKVAK